jgi:co-chaperonin GroES (HSP10)
MATKFTPLHDRILVRRVDEVGTTRGWNHHPGLC